MFDRIDPSATNVLRPIAAKLVWWKPPEEVLGDPADFACRVMTLGTWSDVLAARRVLGDDVLRAALRSPTPGVFDARSWRYWHLVFNRTPIPPLPKRNLA